MNPSNTTYANSGACRRAAKKALGADAERGTDFQMEVNEEGRWSWWALSKEAPGISTESRGPTREGWLRELVYRSHEELFRDPTYCEEAGMVPAELPKFRVSCSWPGGGSPRKRIGECWQSTASADGATEMMVSPAVGDPMQVAATLVHEMIHMYLPEAKHGRQFRRLALAVGLEGKMTATVAGDRLRARLESMLQDMGPYPHAQLSTAGRKKQSTRLLKVSCIDEENCGCVFRLTLKWVEHAHQEDVELSCPVCKGDVELG